MKLIPSQLEGYNDPLRKAKREIYSNMRRVTSHKGKVTSKHPMKGRYPLRKAKMEIHFNMRRVTSHKGKVISHERKVTSHEGKISFQEGEEGDSLQYEKGILYFSST
ncbi:unnamed protein product [Rhizophagus irregularis]|nr:unnamed protein product [Rhizophagus irregularis]CAB5215214.1 unnamed protein product [Rhizophagus irregularis]